MTDLYPTFKANLRNSTEWIIEEVSRHHGFNLNSYLANHAFIVDDLVLEILAK